LKPGKDKSSVTSYRPISLTSCVCKLFEKMVNNRLVYTLENREVVPAQQYGFRKNKSTADLHIILESSSQEAFRKKQHFVMVSLDLVKAYDTCWRRHTAKTLADNKIHGNKLHFVRNFMVNRTFRLMLGAESSEKLTLRMGWCKER
jgi:hypothetical protein